MRVRVTNDGPFGWNFCATEDVAPATRDANIFPELLAGEALGEGAWALDEGAAAAEEAPADEAPTEELAPEPAAPACEPPPPEPESEPEPKISLNCSGIEALLSDCSLS